MNKTGILVRGGGFAAALAAHAVFASVLLAGQPAPDAYLARLAPHGMPAPEVQLAARRPRQTAAAGMVPTAGHPARLIRGLITC